MKFLKILTPIAVFTMLVSGCVSMDPLIKKFESHETKLIHQHIEKGESLEKENHLSSALEQYKLALTIDPENKEAVQHKEKVLPKLWETAQIHYRNGLELDAQGKYSSARKEYLSALQNWPEYKEAKEKLTPGRITDKEKDYIIHTLAYGESVSKLAMIYYGDFKKQSVIGEFNLLKDLTKVRVGDKLIIPVIDGFPLQDLKQKQEVYLNLPKTETPVETPNKPEEEKETTAIETSTEPETVLPPAEEVAQPEQEPVKEIVQETKPSSEEKVSENYEQAIELFNQKKYPESIPLFLAAAEADPDNETLLDYLFKSHFQQALILFDSEDYLMAKSNFESALKYNKYCEKCPDYIEKCETTYKEKHYNLGIHYFGKEQLKKAIEEWNLVKNIDPAYKDVTPNLQKAEMLLKRLESIKKGSSE